MLKCCLEDGYDPKLEDTDNPNLDQWWKVDDIQEWKRDSSLLYEYEYSLRKAAEKYVRHLCSRDPDYYSTFLNGLNVVLVKDSSGTIHRMNVEAEQSIEFNISEVK